MKRKTGRIIKAISAVLAAALLCSCTKTPDTSDSESSDSNSGTVTNVDYKYEQELNIIDDNYRNYYEIFVYSFCDTDGDGIGDLKGITSKLDYIQDLGFNGIWLTPIMPSTTYHKYDVTDYCAIDPEFGTMEDFDELVAECNKRGIKLILDLVMNHSSSQHEWFKTATKALAADPCGAAEDEECLAENEICPTHNKYIDYYFFSKEIGGGYNRLGSTDWYYESNFWDQMPDLNLENEDVRREFEEIAKFWLDKGVGGFRLDAVMWYVSSNATKNNEIVNWLMEYCKTIDPDVYMVAEVWTNLNTFVEYYESGIPSIFNYAVGAQSGKIVNTINMSGSGNSVQSFANAMVTIEDLLASHSEVAIDAPFIGNHDNARTAGYFQYKEERLKAAAGLLLTMTGSPFVYYGEEIAMTGSGDKDENYRAPLIWDALGTGQTKGPDGMDPQENKFGNVAEQLEDPNSILNYYKRALRIRNENPAIARGKTVVLDVDGDDYAAIERTWDGDTITIVYNYSEEEHEFTDAALALDSKQIRGYLTIDNSEEVTLDGSLVMPPYSIVFLADK